MRTKRGNVGARAHFSDADKQQEHAVQLGGVAGVVGAK